MSAAALQSRDGDVVLFAKEGVEALETEEDEAVVAQYGWLKKVSGRVPGGEFCVFRSVHVDACDGAVVVLDSGPVKMPGVLVVVELAFSAARMTAWSLE